MLDLTNMRLSWAGLFDPRTGLPSSGLTYDRLRQALTLARREGLAVSVLLVTWDTAPDRGALTPEDGVVIDREIAQRVCNALRASDTVGLLDERHLIVVLPHARDESVPDVAARVRSRVAEPVRVGNLVVEITPLVGAAIAGGGDRIQEADDVIDQARDALVLARESGQGFAALETPAARPFDISA